MAYKRKPKAELQKRGAKTKYKAEYNHLAYIACSEGGFTDLKLARLFDCDVGSITRWKRVHPLFYAAIQKGKDEFNCAVAEQSLLKRVKGGKTKEVVKERTFLRDDKGDLILKDGKPQLKLTVTKETIREILPEPTCLKFFLKNRSPERWPDKNNYSGELDVNYSDMTQEQLDERIKELQEKISEAGGED